MFGKEFDVIREHVWQHVWQHGADVRKVAFIEPIVRLIKQFCQKQAECVRQA